jgi:hypothetical protein
MALPGNRIDDEGCLWLSKTPWPHLTSLRLCSNIVSSKGFSHLTKMHAPNLKTLSITRIRNNFEGVVRIHLMRINSALKEVNYWDYELD